MAIPKSSPEPQDWIRANAQELQVTDREVLAMLRASYREVGRMLADLEKSGTGTMRRAQLEESRARLLAQQADVFERLGDIVSARRARAAVRAQRLSAAGTAVLLGAVGRSSQAQALYDGALETSQRAIDAALARMKLSALPLSQRIYKTNLWMGGRLGKLINETMASGLNAKEFAKKARDWFNPNTPGGIRYAAMRLARTEINNAFHSMSALKAAEKPWVNDVEWHLSRSHPTPDECDEYAKRKRFPADRVPARPHPQCMCYITEVAIEEDAFIENLLNGDYDDYLDREMAKSDPGSAPVDKTPAPLVNPAAPAEPQPEPEIRTTVKLGGELDQFVESLVRVEGDGREEVIDELKVQAGLTPKAIRKLQGVSKMTKAEEKALKQRFGNDAIGGYTSETRTIGIASEVFTDKYEKGFTKEVKNGFLSKCPHGHKHDGLKSFIAHEYGHHVEDVIRMRGDRAMKPVWVAVGTALGIKPPLLMDRTSINRWVEKNKPLIAKQVSKYGTESGGELLAEVWAEYTRNPDARPHIKAIGDAIKAASESAS